MPEDPADTLDPQRLAVYANGYQAVTPWVQSTGYRTHGLRFAGLGDGVDLRLAETFLRNTCSRRSDRETQASIAGYFTDPAVQMLAAGGVEDLACLTTVTLPAGARLRRELGDVLGNRRSVRMYTGDSIPLEQVATLVRAGGAVTGQSRVDLLTGGQAVIQHRTAPSPGGLYPVELYLLTLRVPGTAPGVWRYQPRYDVLVHTGDERRMRAALDGFSVTEDIISLSQAALVMLLLARPWKALRKYGDRGLRYVLLEAGAIAENLHLAAGGLGLGSVDCASFYDDEVHAALGVDGELCALVHTVIVGVPG
jgi:SagB-type dehydrogenase family enzyme